MAGDDAQYYNSPIYSDVTICFSGQEVKAHKLILSRGSTYFKKAFEGKFKEANASTITLEGDDPFAVRGLVGWLYGIRNVADDSYLDFLYPSPPVPSSSRPRSKRKREIEDSGGDETDAPRPDFVKYLVSLYAAAGKYLVPALQYHIEADFRDALSVASTTNSIDHLTRHVYLERGEEARGLRQYFVSHYADRIHIRPNSEKGEFTAEFRELMLELPQLNFALMSKLSEKVQASQRAYGLERHGPPPKRRRYISDDDVGIADFMGPRGGL